MAGVYERFDQKIEADPFGGCWLWSGSQNRDGYGQVAIGGNRFRTHRVAYARYFGEIPNGCMVRHKCDVPSCVNPSHLEIGTVVDNGIDKAVRGRAARKLSNDEARLIRASSLRSVDLANRYGVSPTTIYDIRKNRRRRYV